jgi:predicted nucleotidyltransferase
MSKFSSPFTVPEDRPVPESILQILATMDRVATEQECPYVVVGATARDLLLFHVFGIPARRATLDVDFAIAVQSWDKFHRMRNALLATEEFVPDKVEHRLYFKRPDIPIDLIPFGGVAEDDTIAWPPARDTVMTVAGFEDAMAASIQVQVSPTLAVPVVSLAAPDDSQDLRVGRPKDNRQGCSRSLSGDLEICGCRQRRPAIRS